MIGAWMLTAALFALFAALAALCGEQALRALGRQARVVWVVAIAASLLWPITAALIAREPSADSAVLLPPIRVTQLVSPALERSSTTWMPDVDRLLLLLWGAASAIMLVRLAAGARRARRLRRSAERQELAGVPLLVSAVSGPAVIGLVRPDILYPRGLLDLEPALRDVIIRHEDEHRRAGDAWLAFGCSLALVLMPWNAALWWMTRRARLALEIDCDARVLRAHVNVAQYGKLLLLVSQTDADPQLAPALVSSPSHLERRIRAMLDRTPTHRSSRIVLGSAGLVLASIAACSARVTNDTARRMLPTPAAGLTQLAVQRAFMTNPDTVAYERVEPPRVPYMPNAATELKKRTTPVPMPNAIPVDTGAARKDTTKTFFEFQIEKQATIVDGSYFMKYPDALKDNPKNGEALVQFVVRADSTLMPGSLKILKVSDPAFIPSIRDALGMARFTPAMTGNRAVNQLVQKRFEFPVPPKM